MRRVLALPVEEPLTGRLKLPYPTGRNTGPAYRHPVSYVSEGDVLAQPEIISDVDQIEQSLAIIIGANPTAGRFVAAGTRPDGGLDRQRPETTIRHGFRIIPCHIEAGEAPIVLSRKVDRS